MAYERMLAWVNCINGAGFGRLFVVIALLNV